MQKLYLDRTEFTGAVGLDLKDSEIISAGATISSIGVHDWNETYQKYADDYDIHFIVDDAIPRLEFYTVPHVDIMAMDSKGGFIGVAHEQCDLESHAPICYISKDLVCLTISENGQNFLNNIALWQDNMIPFNRVTVCRSKAEAKMELEFIDLSGIDAFCPGKK